MKIRIPATFLLILVFLGGMPHFALAATSTVTSLIPAADTYVDSSKPSTNFGSSSLVWIDASSPSRRALLRFSLSSIPAGSTITSAVLKLNITADGSSVAGTVKTVSGSWSESTVTYGTAPAVGSTIAAIPGPATAGSSVSVNITSYVIGKSTINLYVTSSSTDGVQYYSREKGTTLAPRLIVTWTAPTTPTATMTAGPSSTPTPTSTATTTASAIATRTATPTATRTATPTFSPTTGFTPSPTAGSETVTALTPTADSYIDSGLPSSNFGSSTLLWLDNDPSIRRALLRFSLSSIPAGSEISSAVLKLYITADGSSTAGSVNSVSGSWTESSVTYSTAPAVGALIASIPGPATAGSSVSVDLTSYVIGKSTVDLYLVTSSSDAVQYYAREKGSTFAPRLIVTWSPAAAATPTLGETFTPTVTLTATATPSLTASPTPSATATSQIDQQPSFPIRAAFYYPWFPEAWTQQGIYPYTNYHPQLGYYSSSDAAILQQHIDMMQYAGIQAGIASWWGQGSKTDARIPALLSAASGTTFRWALYYEPESQGDPTPAQIQNDLTYMRDHYASDPSFLRVNGKFVVFVYADANDGCGMADRWKQGNTVGAYVVLKVFSGYLTCASQPDDWHQYAPAVAEDHQGSHSFSISPGFWLVGNAVRLSRDLTRWSQNVRDMVASGSRWQLVTTFSEWGKGTAVEPATEWASASGYGQYLDVLHDNGGDPVVMAAGDIVCPDLVTSDTTCQQMAVSQLILDQNPDAVLPLGDLCQNTSVNCFYNYYDPSWGRMFSISYPITGNHEYGKTGAQYYFDYWNGLGVVGGRAGERGKGYYSFDVGTWHVVALNSQCEYIGGCDAASPQYAWLQQDLESHTNQCTLAISHKPLFGSSSLTSTVTRPLWQLLYDHNADVILDGHSHIYERFAPQDPNGAADPLRGIREFIVGTGGAFHTGIGTLAANSEVRNATTFGALKLTLRQSGYDWQFLPVPGKTFTDSGTGLCH